MNLAAANPGLSAINTRDITANDHVIRRLYDITSRHELGFAEQTRELLRLGCGRFGLEIGILSHIDDGRDCVSHFNTLDPGDHSA